MVAMDDRLTTSAAARVAGVSEQTVRTWMRAGRLPSEITPLGRLIAPRDLGAVIAAREAAQRERGGRHAPS